MNHIKRKIKRIFIILSIFFRLISIVIPVSANTISYEQSHHSYRVIHDNFIEQEGIPTISTDSFEVYQNVTLPLGNMSFGVSSGIAAETGANLSTNGVKLGEHLSQLEKYGQAGVKTLENGKIRYYGNVAGASKQGTMIGRRVVREWNPSNGLKRTWMETLDGAGNTRIVRPQFGNTKGWHYGFDEFGNFTGSWK